MPLTFRTAVAAFAIVLAPLAASAQSLQDDGRPFDVQLAEQIATACGSDGGACAAILAVVPANSPLQEMALTAAVSSGMTDAEVAQVAAAAKPSAAQAQRVQTVAAARGRSVTATTAIAAAATTSPSAAEVAGSAA